MNESNLNSLVEKALSGDTASLEKFIRGIQDFLYNLCIRFFSSTPDVEDATQEILIKVITNLSTFEKRSNIKTWIYRIATNHLLNMKRAATEQITFVEGAEYLELGMQYPNYTAADKNLLEEEVKIHCTTSMLVCLSRPIRIAYILGEILDFKADEVAYILDISEATFRKRLSLGRQYIRNFMSIHCGLYDKKNTCRCSKQINYGLAIEWFDKKQRRFGQQDHLKFQLSDEIDAFTDEVAIFHSLPIYSAPELFLKKIKGLLESDKYGSLGADQQTTM